MAYIKIWLGLFLGLTNYWLSNYSSLGTAGNAFVFVASNIILFVPQIKLPPRSIALKSSLFLIGMGILYGAIAYRTVHIWTSCFLIPECVMSSFIVLVFYCVALEQQRCTFPYQNLFNEAWKVIFRIILGTIFVSSIWGLCCFAGFLFGFLSITAVRELVSSQAFNIIMYPIFFSLLMVALDNYEEILIKFRDILLVFCKFLYPVCLVISLCFLCAAPFSLPRQDILNPLIIAICSLNITLFNGVFQAGLTKPPYAKWFTPLISLSFIILSIYSFSLLKEPLVNLTNMGLTTPIFLSLLARLFLITYPVSYAIAVIFSKQPWLSMIKGANTYIAIAFAVVYTILGLFLTCPSLAKKPTLMVSNTDFKGSPGCFIACYSHQKENSAYAIGNQIYVMGQIRVSGNYNDKRICYPTGFENKDISVAPQFIKLCGEKIKACDKGNCWAGGDSGGM